VLHARRHPRRGPHPRRERPRRPGHAGRPGEHVPPDAGPGAGVVASLGGLHRWTGFGGHILTDSGGFQVFSLGDGVAVDDEGVTLRSTYDGSTHRLTPELAVGVQAELGADIQMALDVCTR